MNYVSSQIQCILDTHALNIIHTTIISIAIIVSVYYFNYFSQKAITKLQRGRKLDASLLKIFQNVITIIIYALGFILLLQNLHIKMSALLGAVGIITVSIGVALQKIVANIASGMFILTYKPFAMGDYISCNHPHSTFKGKVTNIDLRTTTLVDENNIILVPNQILYENVITILQQ